jgi:N6-adenosine-specific RNA methylase IME4
MEQLSAGRFAAILTDPPWSFATYSAKGKGRSSEAWYDVMSIDDIKALPVGRWAAADAVLFLWVTKPILPGAFEIINAWGFEYKTNAFVWVKTIADREPALFTAPPRFHFGMGHWTRSNPEQCLLATRGKPRRLNADVPELIVAPRREHSRKPDEIYWADREAGRRTSPRALRQRHGTPPRGLDPLGRQRPRTRPALEIR